MYSGFSDAKSFNTDCLYKSAAFIGPGTVFQSTKEGTMILDSEGKTI